MIQGPCFLEGIGFLCFSRFKEADGLLCLTVKSSVDLGEEILEKLDLLINFLGVVNGPHIKIMS